MGVDVDERVSVAGILFVAVAAGPDSCVIAIDSAIVCTVYAKRNTGLLVYHTPWANNDITLSTCLCRQACVCLLDIPVVKDVTIN